MACQTQRNKRKKMEMNNSQNYTILSDRVKALPLHTFRATAHIYDLFRSHTHRHARWFNWNFGANSQLKLSCLHRKRRSDWSRHITHHIVYNSSTIGENRWIIFIFSFIFEWQKLIKICQHSVTIICKILRKRFLPMRTRRYMRVTWRTHARRHSKSVSAAHRLYRHQAQIVLMLRADGLAARHHSIPFRSMFDLSFILFLLHFEQWIVLQKLYSFNFNSKQNEINKRWIVGAQWKWVWHNTSESGSQREATEERKKKKTTFVNRRSAQCSCSSVRKIQIESEAQDKSCCREQIPRDMNSAEYKIITQQPNVEKRKISDTKFGKIKRRDWLTDDGWVSGRMRRRMHYVSLFHLFFLCEF